MAYQMGKRRGRKERKRGGRGGEQEVGKCGGSAAKWVAAEQEGRQGGEGKKGEKMAAG